MKNKAKQTIFELYSYFIRIMNIRCNQIIIESKIYHYEIDIKTTQWITWLIFCKRYLKEKKS